MTEERCEPPPELRGVDGWHHVNVAGIERPVWWTASAIIPPNADYMEFAPAWIAPGGGRVGPLVAYHRKWRYIAPVVTPADVDALRAERDAAIARDRNASAAHATRATDLWLVTEERDNLRAGTDRLIAERTTLRARMAKSDAMQDSAFIAGMTAGWNFAMCGDHAGMMHARSNREGYLAALKGKIHD